jgi:hypothetical protein
MILPTALARSSSGEQKCNSRCGFGPEAGFNTLADRCLIVSRRQREIIQKHNERTARGGNLMIKSEKKETTEKRGEEESNSNGLTWYLDVWQFSSSYSTSESAPASSS